MNALRLLALGAVIYAGGGLVARADGRPEPVPYTYKAADLLRGCLLRV